MDLFAPFTWAFMLIIKIMMWPLVIVILLFFALGKEKTLKLLRLLIGRKTQPETELSYKGKGPLMTAAEQHFYSTLTSIAPADNLIMSKVRIADILEPNEKGKRYQIAFNKICAKHMDFVVVNKENMEVLICIELNDKSHKRKDRQKRDKMLAEAFKTAGIPLLFYPARRNYSEQEVSDSINQALTPDSPTLEDIKV